MTTATTEPTMTLAQLARRRVELTDRLRDAAAEHRRAQESLEGAKREIERLTQMRLLPENKERVEAIDALIARAQERSTERRQECIHRNSLLAEAQGALATLEREHESPYAKAKREAEEAQANVEAVDADIARLEAEMVRARRVTLDDLEDIEGRVNRVAKQLADRKNDRAKAAKVLASATSRRDAARLEELRELRAAWRSSFDRAMERERAGCRLLVEIGKELAKRLLEYDAIRAERDARMEDFELLGVTFGALDVPATEVNAARQRVEAAYPPWAPVETRYTEQFYRWQPADELEDAGFRLGILARLWLVPPESVDYLVEDMPLREGLATWARTGEWPSSEPEAKPEPTPEVRAEPAKPEAPKPLPEVVTVPGDDGTERVLRVTHKGAPKGEESGANAE